MNIKPLITREYFSSNKKMLGANHLIYFLFIIVSISISLNTPFALGKSGELATSLPDHCLALSKNLKIGTRDATTNGEVTKLQKFLKLDNEVYPSGNVTGYFGILTDKAIKQFQFKYGLPNTGLVGPLTRNLIGTLCKDSQPEIVITTLSLPNNLITYPFEYTSSSSPSSNFRSKVYTLVNEERNKAGLLPLFPDPLLDGVAQDYARLMDSIGKFGHTGPDGKTPQDRITASGYKWITSGENIARGYTTPEEVMKGWLTSTGHRANILNKNFTDIGIGYYNNVWVQDFGGRNQTRPCIKGCAPSPIPADKLPKLTVTSPAINKEWKSGSDETISWSFSGSETRFRVYLLENNNPTNLITLLIGVSSTPQTIDIEVPNIPNGNYLVRVCDDYYKSGSFVCDNSDVSITIKNDSPQPLGIRIIKPNGGEIFTRKDTANMQVEISSSQKCGQLAYYYVDNSQNYKQILSSGGTSAPFNVFQYGFPSFIPSSDNYKLYVSYRTCDGKEFYEDSSDGTFSIK